MEFQELFQKAHAIGMAAGEQSNTLPTVMRIHDQGDDTCTVGFREAKVEDALMDSDGNSTDSVTEYYLDRRHAGFVWITILTPVFGDWLLENGLADKSDDDQTQIIVGDFDSFLKKIAYASAFTSVLADNNIGALVVGKPD